MKHSFLDKSEKLRVSCLSFQREVMKNNPFGDPWYKIALNNPIGHRPDNNPSEQDERQRRAIDALFNEEFYKFTEENN
jgi:hypothetical protein